MQMLEKMSALEPRLRDKMVLENFPFTTAVGAPALFGFVGLFITAAIFKRPYIAIAGGVLGVLLGMGMV